MKLDVPDEYLPLIVTALEHYSAYARAVEREDARYQEAADWFKRIVSDTQTAGWKGQRQTGVMPSITAFLSESSLQSCPCSTITANPLTFQKLTA